ncbi:PREDICTED: uncharacterized protein LOC109326941 [Lupinus angustifolius]|uniref:uncharacterized protein LOC109326941 n=1 Tax=Lupinus angustifolius TaxID=3871 RepID=UPI00092EAB6B|nr:PREDICTED: uncharacterized protein LOC109326941 [Lupinus angustifolius]
MASSWKKTITTPFKKARTFFNPQSPREHNKSLTERANSVMDLHGEVMACSYKDVQVMWSILDKSKTTGCNITSS